MVVFIAQRLIVLVLVIAMGFAAPVVAQETKEALRDLAVELGVDEETIEISYSLILLKERTKGDGDLKLASTIIDRMIYGTLALGKAQALIRAAIAVEEHSHSTMVSTTIRLSASAAMIAVRELSGAFNEMALLRGERFKERCDVTAAPIRTCMEIAEEFTKSMEKSMKLAEMAGEVRLLVGRMLVAMRGLTN